MLSPRSMRRSSSLKVASVLAIASESASAGLSAPAATFTGPPESAKSRRTARSTGVSLATRRSAARASTSLSPGSSAVLILTFGISGSSARVGQGYDRVCSYSRLKRYFREWERHGRDPSDRHRQVVEAHGHQHRDHPLLRAGGLVARSRSEPRRLPALRDRPSQAPELHPPRPHPGVFDWPDQNPFTARRRAQAPVRRGSGGRGGSSQRCARQDSRPQEDGAGTAGDGGEVRAGQALRLRIDRGALSKRLGGRLNDGPGALQGLLTLPYGVRPILSSWSEMDCSSARWQRAAA